ncbi:unnamed protein product [Effrenium voratum]|nr:unnamed protein product [Effrenium voratum]
MNLRRYACVPRDWQALQKELRRILVDVPDVICVQEGLEGMDILTQVGYKRIASSVLRAQALRDAVYGNAPDLSMVSSSFHGRLLVNELYMRDTSNWEAIDSGAAQISSDAMLDLEGAFGGAGQPQARNTWPLATRSVVWTKLRHRARPAGPFAYVLNTQLTGGNFEDQYFAALAEERHQQMERLLELFDRHLRVGEEDIGILAGSLGVHPKDAGPQVPLDASDLGLSVEELRRRFQAYLGSPFQVLRSHGWKMAYQQRQVGPTSPDGLLVDHMATNREVAVHAEVLPSASQTALSDYDFVKARFSLRLQAQEGAGQGLGAARAPERRVDAMVEGLRNAQWMNDGALAAAVKAGANQRMRLRCEQEDLRRQLLVERREADELQAELTSEMRELGDRCQEQGQTVGLLTQRLADARNAIQVELQDAATERARLSAELFSEESQRQQLQDSLQQEESEASARVEAADQQLASMASVRDSLQAQLQSALRVQTELREHIAAERDGRAELEVAGERELLAWERRKESMQASPVSEKLKSSESQRLQQHLNAEAAICEQEAATFRQRVSQLSEELQESQENKQRALAALGAVGCEWPLLREEAAEAVELANSKEAELEGVNRRARDLQKQLDSMKEDILQCRQDHLALELKGERDLLNEEVQQEAIRQEELFLELDSARRSRSFLQCLFPRTQPPLPPPTPAPPERARTASLHAERQPPRGGAPSLPKREGPIAADTSSEESSEEAAPPRRQPRPEGRPPEDFIESDEV